VHVGGRGRQLLGQLRRLDEPDPVFAGDRAAERDRRVEDALRGRRGPQARSRVAAVEEERRVNVAVARMAPAARLELRRRPPPRGVAAITSARRSTGTQTSSLTLPPR
jgi:hypothetical protein